MGGLERELLVRSTPAGRNSTPRGDYAPVGAVDRGDEWGPPVMGQDLARNLGERCQGNSSCVPICPVQAKYNALKTLSKAADTGRVTVLPRAVASVSLSTAGASPASRYLRYDDPHSPAHTTGVAVGTTYVLACHAVENAKLMLISDLQSANELGRRLPAGPPDAPDVGACRPSQIGAYRGPQVDVRHRGPARGRLPPRAFRVSHRDRQRRVDVADGHRLHAHDRWGGGRRRLFGALLAPGCATSSAGQAVARAASSSSRRPRRTGSRSTNGVDHLGLPRPVIKRTGSTTTCSRGCPPRCRSRRTCSRRR